MLTCFSVSTSQARALMIEELRGDAGQTRLLQALERADTIARFRRDAERQRRIQASTEALFARFSSASSFFAPPPLISRHHNNNPPPHTPPHHHHPHASSSSPFQCY